MNLDLAALCCTLIFAARDPDVWPAPAPRDPMVISRLHDLYEHSKLSELVKQLKIAKFSER